MTWATRAALLVAAICATVRVAHADCPAGTPQAACVLHEEGVALLTAQRYDEAATKFRAAIAAGPSARSYLGYSQAVEGQGKLALAYETMLVAKRLSDEELAGAGAKDPVNIGRAERIKYKLGELGGRIGFVWLRLPEGIPPQRLVSIHREGEGDLPSPLGRWVTVAPDQVLIASLDDGTELRVPAKAAAGSQVKLVIPVPARPQPPPPQPPPQQPPLQRPPPTLGPPVQTVYQPPPPPPRPPLPRVTVAVGMTILSSGAELPDQASNLGAGIGAFGLLERRAGKSLGLTFRADYVSHPTGDTPDGVSVSLSGYELMMLVGVRTMTRNVHARIEAGLSVSTVEAEAFGPGGPIAGSETDVHPVIGFGGGLHLGRIRLHASLLYAANPDSGPDRPQMPVRFMGVIGFDLWRR